MQKLVYSIEGNIGSGKTTLLKVIAKQLSIQTIAQPLKEWQKIGEHNLLSTYYSQPERWAYTFQTYALLTRMSQLKQIQRNSDKNVFFTERSILGDKNIFAQLLHQQAKMSNIQFELYQKMFKELEGYINAPTVHRYIYLRTSPEKCLERIKKRERQEQSSISLDYLTKIHNLHENWLTDHSIINGQQDFENDASRLQEIVSQIQEHINEK